MVVELFLLGDALQLLTGDPEVEVLAAELLPEEVVEEPPAGVGGEQLLKADVGRLPLQHHLLRQGLAILRDLVGQERGGCSGDVETLTHAVTVDRLVEHFSQRRTSASSITFTKCALWKEKCF